MPLPEVQEEQLSEFVAKLRTLILTLTHQGIPLGLIVRRIGCLIGRLLADASQPLLVRAEVYTVQTFRRGVRSGADVVRDAQGILPFGQGGLWGTTWTPLQPVPGRRLDPATNPEV